MITYMRNPDALTCDFAEYYGIKEWRCLPGRYAATLAAGLRPDSRSYMAACGVHADKKEALLAANHDLLAAIVIALSGKNAASKIKFIADEIINGPKETEVDAVEDFESEWNRRVEE